MGFIKDNTNTFEVYLTDLGKQKLIFIKIKFNIKLIIKKHKLKSTLEFSQY